MKKILRFIFTSIILFFFFVNIVNGVLYGTIEDVYYYEDYEKTWNQEIDKHILNKRDIFIGTITDSKREYHKKGDMMSHVYDVQVHAYWGNKQTKTTKLITVQYAGTKYGGYYINRFDKNKTYIFFNKSNNSYINKDNNIKLKEIGQGNSVKYLSKLGSPDYVYQSEEHPMLADLKTFHESQEDTLGDYEDENFIYKKNYIVQVKNTDKLIKLGKNIFQYENKILFQKGNKYQLFMIKGNDFQFKELGDYYLVQNHEMIYGISKSNQKQTISLIYNLGNFKEMKHKFGNFYEDNNNVYFIEGMFGGLPSSFYSIGPSVSQELIREEGDFQILKKINLEVDYTVRFDSISKELFNKVHNVYESKLKKLNYEKKLSLLEKLLEIKNPYYDKKNSKNDKFVKKYKESEFILNYLVGNLQLETQNRKINTQQQNDVKHLMGNVFEYEGEILIKKGDKYLYYYKKADDFNINMVNGYVLIYNNSELYSISQTSPKPTVLKIKLGISNEDFDFDTFTHVEGKLYKDDQSYYLPSKINSFSKYVGKFGYDIGGINQKDNINIQYDYSIRLYGKKKSYMSSLLRLRNAEYTDMTEDEIRENIKSIQLERKYFGTNVHMLFHDYFKIEGLEKQLKRLQDEK